MFRITEDPSSGSLVQYSAKITRMVLVILAKYCTSSNIFRITEDPSSGSLVQYLAKITRMVLVILAKYYKNGSCNFSQVLYKLPDDGSSVIRNILEYF